MVNIFVFCLFCCFPAVKWLYFCGLIHLVYCNMFTWDSLSTFPDFSFIALVFTEGRISVHIAFSNGWWILVSQSLSVHFLFGAKPLVCWSESAIIGKWEKVWCVESSMCAFFGLVLQLVSQSTVLESSENLCLVCTNIQNLAILRHHFTQHYLMFYRFPRSTCLNFLGSLSFIVFVATFVNTLDLAMHTCPFLKTGREFCRNC